MITESTTELRAAQICVSLSVALLLLNLSACTPTVKRPVASVAGLEIELSDTALSNLYKDLDRSYRALLTSTAADCERAGPYAWSPVREGQPAQSLRLLRGFGLRPQANDCEQRAVYSAVLRWMQRHLVGLDSNSTAAELVLRPAPLGQGRHQITRMRASMELSTGIFKTQWQVNGPRMIVNVQLPANTELLLSLPTSRAEQLRVGGKSLQESGLQVLDADAPGAHPGTISLRLQGGAKGMLTGFSFPLAP